MMFGVLKNQVDKHLGPLACRRFQYKESMVAPRVCWTVCGGVLIAENALSPTSSLSLLWVTTGQGLGEPITSTSPERSWIQEYDLSIK